MRGRFALLRETVFRLCSPDQSTMGSGFIISSAGLALTTFDAITRARPRKGSRRGTARFEVQLDVGMLCAARLISEGPEPERFDFAVLQLETSGLPFLELDSTASVEPGDEVAYAGFSRDSSRLSAHRGFVAAKYQAATLRLRQSMEEAMVLHIDGGWCEGYQGGPVLNAGSKRVVALLSSRLSGSSVPTRPTRAVAVEPAIEFLKAQGIRYGNLADRTLF